jgi:hypothetical protein
MGLAVRYYALYASLPDVWTLKGTAMTNSPGVAFHHQKNDDGTITSICMNCYGTVAEQSDPSELSEMEQTHVCEERHIRRMNVSDRSDCESPAKRYKP